MACLLFLFFGLTFLTLISSICYLFGDDKAMRRWDNIIMAEFIYFKSIDLCLLSFFDFFDSSELFNATLFITLEKVLWMIIEAILDGLELKEKSLIIIQIVSSIIPSMFFILYFCIYCCFCCIICKEYINKNVPHNNEANENAANENIENKIIENKIVTTENFSNE